MSRKERLRGVLKDTVDDLVADLLYYDRKEDEQLSRSDLYRMFANEWISKDEIVRWFKEALDRVEIEEDLGE
jgi:hypothetical protein